LKRLDVPASSGIKGIFYDGWGLKLCTEAYCGRANSERADLQIVIFGYNILKLYFGCARVSDSASTGRPLEWQATQTIKPPPPAFSFRSKWCNVLTHILFDKPSV
jgi:hypothetical protein